MIVAGTGHRPEKVGGYTHDATARLILFARTWLQEHRPDKVISGMALGWDQALAQAAVDMGIPFVAAVPFKGFECRWPMSSQEKFWKLLDRAIEVKIVHSYPGTVAMQLRNQWMVNRCDLLLALWDGSWGGTFNCIQYANKHGRQIENLWLKWQMQELLR